MTRTSISRGILATLFASLAVSTGLAHDPAAPERGRELFQPGLDHATDLDGDANAARPPLYDGLGDLTMPVTTRSTEAQAYFDQGLRLTWAFNHAEAWRSFRTAQGLDPECAMCFWGEAFALGPNINDGMRDAAALQAYDAIGRAMALKGRVTDKERMLIEALATRYAASVTADRSGLDQAWADAMRAVVKAYPEDVNILVLHADALMNL